MHVLFLYPPLTNINCVTYPSSSSRSLYLSPYLGSRGKKHEFPPSLRLSLPSPISHRSSRFDDTL